MKNGQGIYIFHSGSRYEGQWANDQFHQKGIFSYSNGDRYEGIYENG